MCWPELLLITRRGRSEPGEQVGRGGRGRSPKEDGAQWDCKRATMGVHPTSQRSLPNNYRTSYPPCWLRMVAATEPKTIQKAVQIFGALTDEAMRNGSIKKVEKRGNVGEPSKDRIGRDNNKRTRTVNAFATTEERI
ncbi:hypothetical protein Tco_1105479 [Tanacetum coccineum]